MFARDAILAFFTLVCAPLLIRAILSPAELRERPLRGMLTTKQTMIYGCFGGIIAGVIQIASSFRHDIPHVVTQATIIISLVSVPFIALASVLLIQGWLQTRLSDRFGPTPAVVITVALCVLLFGWGNFSEALSWFAGALVPSLLRMKTGSLFACLIASAVTDFCFIGAYSSHIV
jgi:membrane protease YdiL (CAAX protease family)